MITERATSRSSQSYRHEAFFWYDQADFLATIVPFIQGGLAVGEPVLVALTPPRAKVLREALDGEAKNVQFVEMDAQRHNPARIIPRLQQFLTECSGRHRPARGVGEPIWPGQRPEELLESQLHEALLNIAVNPEIPFWLVCPYDAKCLGPTVVEEAQRSHPAIIDSGCYQGSSLYAGQSLADTMFTSDLPQVAGLSTIIEFDRRTVDRLFRYLRLELYVMGFPVTKASAFAHALQLLGFGSIDRGATAGAVRVWNHPGVLICEVADNAVTPDLLLGRRPSPDEALDGFRHVHDLADLVQVRSSATGTRVRIHSWT